MQAQTTARKLFIFVHIIDWSDIQSTFICVVTNGFMQQQQQQKIVTVSSQKERCDVLFGVFRPATCLDNCAVATVSCKKTKTLRYHPRHLPPRLSLGPVKAGTRKACLSTGESRPYLRNNEGTACGPRSMTRQALLGLTFEVSIRTGVIPKTLTYVCFVSFIH